MTPIEQRIAKEQDKEAWRIHRAAADAAKSRAASFAKQQAAGFASTVEHEKVLDVCEQYAHIQMRR
jgi:hypothetical protein